MCTLVCGFTDLSSSASNHARHASVEYNISLGLAGFQDCGTTFELPTVQRLPEL